MPIKKTRTDAWEGKLSEEDRQKLYLLTGSLSYNAAVIAAKENLSIKLPSQATFYRFLERMREEDAALRLAKATQASREVARIAKDAKISDDDLVRSLQSLGADAALQGNVKDATRLVMMACDIARKTAKEEELRQANEKLKLLQAKSDKAAETLASEKLTAKQKEAKLKEIYGL